MTIKTLIILLQIVALNWCFAQEVKLQPAIWTVDYIKVKEGQLPDLLKFYELNWKAARKYAKKAKYIEDYQLFAIPEGADYQVVLMTKYPNKVQYDLREENFQKIFTKYKPTPILVNGKGSRDMSEIIKSEQFYEPEK